MKKIKSVKKQKTYDRPSWDELFMYEAYTAATRSSCKNFHTGAIIVKERRIISSGYNGAPPGIENCLQRGCRKEEEGIDFQTKGTGTCRGTHAEMNAMNQIARKDLEGTTMYTVYLPCSSCAKAIAGDKIREVVYSQVYDEPDLLTKEMFAEAGVKLRQFKCLDLEKQFQRMRNIQNQTYSK